MRRNWITSKWSASKIMNETYCLIMDAEEYMEAAAKLMVDSAVVSVREAELMPVAKTDGNPWNSDDEEPFGSMGPKRMCNKDYEEKNEL